MCVAYVCGEGDLRAVLALGAIGYEGAPKAVFSGPKTLHSVLRPLEMTDEPENLNSASTYGLSHKNAIKKIRAKLREGPLFLRGQ